MAARMAVLSFKKRSTASALELALYLTCSSIFSLYIFANWKYMVAPSISRGESETSKVIRTIFR